MAGNAGMRMRRLGLEAVVLVALAGALAVSAAASTAASARTISVFFLRGEQLTSVPRQGAGL